MPKAIAGLDKAKVRKAELLAKKLERYNQNVPSLKLGSPEHRIAKERMVYLLVLEQEKVAKALIRKAKSGDVRAITEFFDRLYGKAKETIDMNANVQFSLKALAEARKEIAEKALEVVSYPIDEEAENELIKNQPDSL
jgi:hypothetical protein